LLKWADANIRVNHYLAWKPYHYIIEHYHKIDDFDLDHKNENITISTDPNSHSHYVFKVKNPLYGLKS